MRTENIYISAESFIFDLRVARRLLREHTTSLCSHPSEVAAALSAVHEIIERIENAATVLQPFPPIDNAPTSDGVGS